MVITIAIILSWMVYYYYANRWSKLPLSFIKKILKTGDFNAIQSLKSIKGEFRYIGKLFEENQIKTKELEITKNKAEESDNMFRNNMIEALIAKNTIEVPQGLVYTTFFDAGQLANVLTLDATDPISKETDFKKCAVKVVKA